MNVESMEWSMSQLGEAVRLADAFFVVEFTSVLVSESRRFDLGGACESSSELSSSSSVELKSPNSLRSPMFTIISQASCTCLLSGSRMLVIEISAKKRYRFLTACHACCPDRTVSTL